MVLLCREPLQLQAFLLSSQFSNVRLSGGKEDQDVRAHALILAAVSPLLRDILTATPGPEWDIVFPDVQTQELESLLQFLYTGTVNLSSRETYNSFLRLVEYLRIDLNPSEPPIEDILLGSNSTDHLWVLKDAGNAALTTLDDSEILYEFPIKIDGTQQLILPLELENINPVPLLGEELQPTSSSCNLEPSKKYFSCTVCSKSFPSKYYLKFHLTSVHSSEASHSCGVCNKGFRGRYYLKQHMRRMHAEGGRPHACTLCPASFGLKYDLLLHTRTHDRRFPCEFCGKTYSSPRSLKEHARTHTGEKPYECKECKKCFALPKTLRVHYRQHSGERPYLCPTCGMTFIQNSTLKHHIKAYH